MRGSLYAEVTDPPDNDAVEDPDPVTSSLSKRGLAIIVTCNYPNCEEYDQLEGADEDARIMKEVLKKYDFEIVLLQNDAATKDGIEQKLKCITSSLSQYENVENKVIIFVFSGHGESGNTIVSQDEEELSLKHDILPHVAIDSTRETPKLFFIDACRGEKYLKAVPKGRPEQQGPGLEIGLQTNYRIDYATIEDYESYSDCTGSAWLAEVAKHLDDDIIKGKKTSLQEIMAEVKKEVWQKVLRVQKDEKTKKKTRVKQQPHTEDRLNCGVLYLRQDM